jgi:hypothetical protein
MLLAEVGQSTQQSIALFGPDHVLPNRVSSVGHGEAIEPQRHEEHKEKRWQSAIASCRHLRLSALL